MQPPAPAPDPAPPAATGRITLLTQVYHQIEGTGGDPTQRPTALDFRTSRPVLSTEQVWHRRQVVRGEVWAAVSLGWYEDQPGQAGLLVLAWADGLHLEVGLAHLVPYTDPLGDEVLTLGYLLPGKPQGDPLVLVPYPDVLDRLRLRCPAGVATVHVYLFPK